MTAERFAQDAQPLFDALLRRARGLTKTTADAEDLVQDTLLHAFMGYHTFRDGTDFKAWLFRILYNRWVSTYRAKQRRPVEVPVDDVAEGDLASSAARSSTASRSAEAEALTRLPDQETQVGDGHLACGLPHRTVLRRGAGPHLRRDRHDPQRAARDRHVAGVPGQAAAAHRSR